MNNTQKIIYALCFIGPFFSIAQAETLSEHSDLASITASSGENESNPSIDQYATDTATFSNAALSIASFSALAQYERASNKKNESMQMPPEIKNLEETKANAANSVFRRYNYLLSSRSADYSSKTNYWWNASNYSCIATVSYNGRINAVNRVNSSDCQ
ncbi:hypothetical protein [Acinetobacter sp. ANC 4178]|uniref:hypothetical protein n=1 Tax=Acinetobacter sp. ANC 4178 TaxID=2529839 RepID=UPI00103FBC33|nr:hypothetical protein [Acinetobacter sp. ANC 4178]TCB66375.1 hypothetical protein E0H87_09900 [Acinetobacter sp. ANC 4178]